MLDSLLDHLARSRGIGDAYYDYRGELKQVSPATKKAILAVMGCRVDDAEAIACEIADLEGFRDLATSITQNAKGDALLKALHVAFDKAAELAGGEGDDADIGNWSP